MTRRVLPTLVVLASFVAVALFVAVWFPADHAAIPIASAIVGLGFVVGFGVSRWTRRMAERLDEETRARSAAERASAVKSRFLANVSHEMRAPLNGVLGLADVLLHRSLDERTDTQVRSIARSARTLLALVDDLLDLSRVRSGHFELETLSFDPEEVGLETCETFAPACHARGLALVLDVDTEVPAAVLGDRLRFGQVLTNLVGNAVKFTERGVVRLALGWREGRLHVSVHDTGIGIPASELGAVFEAYRQVDVATTRRFGGSGLGLAISRDLVRQMGGELEVSSREGEGSVFSFALPMASDGEPAVALEPAPSVWLTADDPVCGSLRSALERLGATVEEVTLDTMAAKLDAPPSPAPVWIWDARMPEPDGALRDALARAVREQRVTLVVHAPTVATLPFTELTTRVLPAPFSREVAARLLRGEGLRGDVLRGEGLRGEGLRGEGLRGEGLRGEGLRSRDDRSPARHARILIAEDDETNRLVVSSIVEELGVRAELVGDGAEAVARVCHDDAVFDVVLMDCQMPVLDGYEATRRIRRWESEQGRARIPILAVSAHALAEERARAMSAGMDGYLTKPLTLESFREALIAHVGEEVRSSIAPPTK